MHTCTICGKNFEFSDKFKAHFAKHPTMGKVYSMMLEKIFKSDKDLLKKAKKMARVVDQAYGTPDERHKGNRHCYFIMFPTEIPPKNLKEFVGLAVYGGREDAVVRETSHNVSNEENPELQAFLEACFRAKLNPIYLKFAQGSTDKKASVIEFAILKAIELKNLANERYGTKVDFEGFDDWTMDDWALLGAYYLMLAFEEFKMLSPEKYPRLVLKKEESRKRPLQEIDFGTKTTITANEFCDVLDKIDGRISIDEVKKFLLKQQNKDQEESGAPKTKKRKTGV